MSQTPRVSTHSVTRDYLGKIRMFSRNAQLFLLSTILRGFAGGIWGVLFNLCLWDLGFREDFVGYVFLLSGLASGLAAFPAGTLCDKIGRKRSLIAGATAGSLANTILVFTSDSVLLLVVSLLGGLVSILSWVAQAPFMMENSEPEERTHLFSIS